MKKTLANRQNLNYLSGLNYLKGKNFVAALDFFQKAIEQTPEFSFAHQYLGEAYFFLSQLDLAEQSFNRARELNPYFAPTLLYLGKIAEQKGDLFKRDELYETVFRQKINSGRELKELAQTLIKIGEAGHPAVFDLYFQAHLLNPQDFEVYLQIAEIAPPNPDFYLKFGEHLAETGKTEQSIFFLYLAARLEPQNRKKWLQLAEVLQKSGDHESAEICRGRAANFD